MPDPADGLGIGVFGTSGKGAGVRGSSQSGEGGQFESESGVGASGTSGSGAGVSGRSGSGIAVTGTSESNRGALFSSAENVAQIHLAPHRQQPGRRLAELPQIGRVGDLILVRSTGEDPEGIPFDFCSLWLCTPKDPRRIRPVDGDLTGRNGDWDFVLIVQSHPMLRKGVVPVTFGTTEE